jgi:hypothetical protein
LQERYARLIKAQYGRRSEKITYLEAVQEKLEDLLSQLEESINTVPESNEESIDVVTIEKNTRKLKHPGRNVIPENIDREVIVHDIPEEEKRCGCCGRMKIMFGKRNILLLNESRPVIRRPFIFVLNMPARNVKMILV